jgi:cytochrome c553
MKNIIAGLALSLLCSVAISAEDIIMPDWAYPPRDRAGGGGGGGGDGDGEVDETLYSVPGSTRQLMSSQTGAMYGGIEDWFPERHGPMPEIVSQGRRPDARACAMCHLTSGLGHPSGGMAAGMSPEYFFQQVKDFASGARTAVDPERTRGMMRVASALTDAEIRDAAEYYARQTPSKWVEVIESEMAPQTFIGGGNMRHVLPDGEMEPLGQRIVEVAADFERTELNDPYSGFIAYVPVGSIEKGEELVTTGGGKTLPCGVCHGPDLKGLGNVPGLAGRLPTYNTRQMLDMKQGTRNGAGAALMMPVLANLALDDIINITAYTASLDP